MIIPQDTANIPQELLRNYLRYKTDPWAFLTECVYTQDQVDKENPIKPYPADWDYLRLYVFLWQKYRLLAVPKSRRMTMSWTNIGLYLWDTIFNPVRFNAFVSKKEDDAAELVKRAEFIFDNIPKEKIPRELLPKKKPHAKPPMLEFPDIHSKIQGFPMGADQLRQFTFSGILGDECAFWEVAREFYAASYPTIEGGGRMSLISSRAPGFFQRLCYDQLDHTGDISEEPPTTPRYPLGLGAGDPPVILWINPKNKFCIFDVHYTANPLKRAPGFKESVKNSMPIKDFMVEYERNWEVFDGSPVFEDYSPHRHETEWEQEPHLGLPLLIGWDFGLTPAAVVAQLRGQTIHIIREYVAQHEGISTFAPTVMRDLAVRYPNWSDMKEHFRHYIDPAGLHANQVDARTCAQEMMKSGIRSIFPGPIDWEARRTAVEHFLITHTKDGPALQLCKKDAPLLAKGFAGGYVYLEKHMQIEPGKPRPVKNKYSHPHDGFQYLCGGALSLLGKRKKSPEIPAPYYSITSQGQGPTQNNEGDNDYGRR